MGIGGDMKDRVCKNCIFWDRTYHRDENRGTCQHSKVLNYRGDEDDGIYEWEAAEKHSGPLFGCIHFEKIK